MWAIIATILFVLGAVLFLLFRAYQIRFRDRLDLATDWIGRPLKNPAAASSPIALVKCATGLAFALIPFVLVWFNVAFGKWALYIIPIGVIYALLLNFVVLRHAKKHP